MEELPCKLAYNWPSVNNRTFDVGLGLQVIAISYAYGLCYKKSLLDLYYIIPLYQLFARAVTTAIKLPKCQCRDRRKDGMQPPALNLRNSGLLCEVTAISFKYLHVNRV